jgi:hypothetical protein
MVSHASLAPGAPGTLVVPLQVAGCETILVAPLSACPARKSVRSLFVGIAYACGLATCTCCMCSAASNCCCGQQLSFKAGFGKQLVSVECSTTCDMGW